MRKLLTPKQVAQAIGVSESSVKRWCDAGKLTVHRTAGGHRRLQTSEVIKFCRSVGQKIEKPELLSLPSNTGQKSLNLSRAATLFLEFLKAGDEEGQHRIVSDLYLAGHEIATICDLVIAPALHQVGEMWADGELRIYEERHACESVGKLATVFRNEMPPPAKEAPLAIGGSLENDHYSVSNHLAELCFTGFGYCTKFLGNDLPWEEFLSALERYKPDICWLSINSKSYFESSAKEFLDQIAAACSEVSADLIIGGQAFEGMQPKEFYGGRYFPDFRSMTEWLKLEGR